MAQMGLQGGTTKLELEGTSLWLGGDIILDIQGQTCSGPHDFTTIRNTVDDLRKGDTFTMHILRAGKILELEAIF
jgi:serine protease Do